MAKGEIARFEQFLFCHYVLKSPSAAEASESVFMRKGLMLSVVDVLYWGKDQSMTLIHLLFIQPPF